jgi:5-methylcytosine-specific restriction endonuclease McrA
MPSSKLKRYVKQRANYCCGLCGQKKLSHELEVHHIVFRSQGGTDSPDNLLALDILCHRAVHKSNHDLSDWLKAKARHQEEQVNPSITGLKYYA